MKKRTKLVIILSLLLGILTGLQIINDSDNFIFANIKTIGLLESEINKNRQEADDIRELINIKRNEINNFQQLEKKGEGISVPIRKELEELKMICGYTDLTGQGIIMKISDNMAQTSSNINFDIVHDVDISIILNDLRSAGAEAISINGKRILSTSEVKCIGPLVKINDEGVAAPFIFKIIGHKDTLFAAVNAPNTYGYDLQNIYGIEINTIKSNFIVISSSDQEKEFQYISKGGLE